MQLQEKSLNSQLPTVDSLPFPSNTPLHPLLPFQINPTMSSPSPSPPPPSSPSSSSSDMWRDIGLQALMFLIGIISFLWSNKIPHKLYNRYTTYRDRNKNLARQHFVKAASLLSKSRSCRANSSLSLSYAAKAASEADHAISLDPSDAAYHVLKALALDLQKFKTSALESIDVALSPVAVKSLSDDEKADALIKRAELRMDVSRLGSDKVDGSVLNVVEIELREALLLNKESARGWFLLGMCLEEMGKIDDAKNGFQEALRIDPDSVEAARGLERLGS